MLAGPPGILKPKSLLNKFDCGKKAERPGVLANGIEFKFENGCWAADELPAWFKDADPLLPAAGGCGGGTWASPGAAAWFGWTLGGGLAAWAGGWLLFSLKIDVLSSKEKIISYFFEELVYF